MIIHGFCKRYIIVWEASLSWQWLDDIVLLIQPHQMYACKRAFVILQHGRNLLCYTLAVETYILSKARFSSMDPSLIPYNKLALYKKRRLMPSEFYKVFHWNSFHHIQHFPVDKLWVFFFFLPYGWFWGIYDTTRKLTIEIYSPERGNKAISERKFDSCAQSTLVKSASLLNMIGIVQPAHWTKGCAVFRHHTFLISLCVRSAGLIVRYNRYQMICNYSATVFIHEHACAYWESALLVCRIRV